MITSFSLFFSSKSSMDPFPCSFFRSMASFPLPVLTHMFWKQPMKCLMRPFRCRYPAQFANAQTDVWRVATSTHFQIIFGCLFFLCECVCVSVGDLPASMSVHQVQVGVTEECGILWNGRYTWLLATMWVLEIQGSSSGRAVTLLSCWASPTVLYMNFFLNW